jgi:(p)ppGpp synthase/HD superfamily hydrolase
MSLNDKVLRDHVALVTRAANYAAWRHVSKRRKGGGGEPYINHLAEVASLLAEAVVDPDAYLVAAGWLHDVLEDTCETTEEIEKTKAEMVRMFGARVTDIVAEVTDDKKLGKEERKRLVVESTPKRSPSARLVTIADKTSNLRSLALSPPKDWNAERIAAYVTWAEEAVVSCRPLSQDLDREFNLAAEAVRGSIDNLVKWTFKGT